MIEANSAYPVYVYNSHRELQVISPSASTLAKLINSNQPTIVSCIKDKSERFARAFIFYKKKKKTSPVVP